MDDHRCDRCGCPLRVETVLVPIRVETPILSQSVEGPDDDLFPVIYEEREEVSDCPRCQGAY